MNLTVSEILGTLLSKVLADQKDAMNGRPGARTFGVDDNPSSEAERQINELIREARIDGMEQAKSRVLRRTEIPKDAKEPTRDIVVEIGELCAEIIDRDIAHLKETEVKDE